ncbi:MAG: hypothetical protein KF773_36930, partial [Deltaproteobacteria bacterium]|nr:hypothetical protein [Deltaproteobacteria bacterium]
MVRADERALLVSAGAVFALASAGAAMSGAAADAMFLAEIGPGSLGVAMAVSSALLAIVLAVVGGLADRLERRRILATLAIVSAATLAGLAALAAVAPRVAAVATFVGGKQLAAATDLAFWVVIAERLDARRSRRVLPMLAATGGAGAAAGGLLVNLTVGVTGAGGTLLAAAALLTLAALGASRMAATRRVKAPAASMSALIARSWRDGARAVRRNPLARHLAILVCIAGAFASFAYFALAVEIAAEGGSVARFAALLGAVRAAAQILTLVVQLVVAPRLLERLGTGQALLFAPLVALASGVGLVIAPVLAIAIATQVSSRVLDAGVETPAEKLAQTLLPSAIRGRVGGFLDGTAKRAGAVLGGLVAAALVATPLAFYVVTAVTAAVWFAAAARIARELPALAVEHAGGSAGELEAVEALDARAIDVLMRELSGPRPERAAEVLTRLHERGRVNAVDPLVRAVAAKGGGPLWHALISVLDVPAEVHGPAVLAAARTERGADLELAVRAVGLCGGVPPEQLAGWRAADHAALALTARVATCRLAGDTEAAFALLGDAVRDTGPTGRAATDELCVEIARARAPGAGAG